MSDSKDVTERTSFRRGGGDRREPGISVAVNLFSPDLPTPVVHALQFFSSLEHRLGHVRADL